MTKMAGGWVVEVDIQSFFDTLDHGCLRGFLDQRVRDGVLRRAIDKWLKAGVLEDGVITHHPVSGSPQGGVISPTTGERIPSRGTGPVVRGGGGSRGSRAATS
jgi:retron-type reverse transcriptase